MVAMQVPTNIFIAKKTIDKSFGYD